MASYIAIQSYLNSSLEKSIALSGLHDTSSNAETDFLCIGSKIELIAKQISDKAYRHAKSLIIEQMDSIDKVATLLLSDSKESINGNVIFESIQSTTLKFPISNL